MMQGMKLFVQAVTAATEATGSATETATVSTSVEQIVENLNPENSFLNNVKNFSLDKILNYGDKVATGLLEFAGNLIIAGIMVMIGFKIAKKVAKTVERVLENRMDQGVVRFLYSFTNMGLKALVLFWAVTKIGVAGSTIVALLGSAALTIGMALQGSMSNIAGGVLILMLKPFQIGDYIIEDNSKNEGTVQDIDLFYTRLQTMDNKTVVIPNGVISNCSLTNVTRQEIRRIDLIVGIDYAENIDLVKSVLTDVIMNQTECLKDKGIQIYVSDFAASCIEMGIRFWVPMEDYWPVRWAVLEKIKKRFDQEGISIPYNQLDVRIQREG